MSRIASEVIGSCWFTQGPNCIGIVVWRDRETRRIRATIGAATGADIQKDQLLIIETGAIFPVQSAFLTCGLEPTMELREQQARDLVRANDLFRALTDEEPPCDR